MTKYLYYDIKIFEIERVLKFKFLILSIILINMMNFENMEIMVTVIGYENIFVFLYFKSMWVSVMSTSQKKINKIKQNMFGKRNSVIRTHVITWFSNHSPAL